jgi:type VI secretion system secreted protein Hcp
MSGSGTTSTIFMCYGSVRGEAQVPGKVKKAPASGGWMQLKSCSFSASMNYGQRISSQVEGGGDVTPILITKLTDASSTGLFREALLGTFDKNVVIAFLRTGVSGTEPQEYLRVELQGCGIVEFGIVGSGEDRAVETFAIRYGRMTVVSWRYDANGQSAAQGMAMIENIA